MLDPESADPVEIALAREGTRARRALLLELPTEQRAALLLSAAGFGTGEIAPAIGLSERQVRKRVEKGNRELRHRSGELPA